MTLEDRQEFYSRNKDSIICVEEGREQTDCPITDIVFSSGPNSGPNPDPRPSPTPTDTQTDNSGQGDTAGENTQTTPEIPNN